MRICQSLINKNKTIGLTRYIERTLVSNINICTMFNEVLVWVLLQKNNNKALFFVIDTNGMIFNRKQIGESLNPPHVRRVLLLCQNLISTQISWFSLSPTLIGVSTLFQPEESSG